MQTDPQTPLIAPCYEKYLLNISCIPFKKTGLPVTKSFSTVCNYFTITAFILHHLRLEGFYFKTQKVLWNAGSRNYGK